MLRRFLWWVQGQRRKLARNKPLDIAALAKVFGDTTKAMRRYVRENPSCADELLPGRRSL